LRSLSVLLVRLWQLRVVFFEALLCVHFCLMNLLMIYQTDLWLKVGEREFEIVVVCYHRTVQIFELY
jgi:hypothetical protein